MKICPHCGQSIPVQADTWGEIASNTGNYLPMIIEYGGGLLAIILYGIGYILKNHPRIGHE